jgi:hypothetical protein
VELSVSHMFIWNNQFPGIMKSAMVKDFHDIKLRIEFFKILTTDRQLIDMVKKNCEEDHANVDTLKLVSFETVYAKSLSYNDSEELIKHLRFINGQNIQMDMAKVQRWIIEFKFSRDVNFFKIILDSQQVLRLYNQVNSFYSNYMVLSSMARQQVIADATEPTNTNGKKVTEYIPTQDVVEQPVTPHELISQIGRAHV